MALKIHTLKESTLRDGAVIMDNTFIGQVTAGMPDCIVDAIEDIGRAVAGEYRLTVTGCVIERSVDKDGVTRITVRAR